MSKYNALVNKITTERADELQAMFETVKPADMEFMFGTDFSSGNVLKA